MRGSAVLPVRGLDANAAGYPKTYLPELRNQQSAANQKAWRVHPIDLLYPQRPPIPVRLV